MGKKKIPPVHHYHYHLKLSIRGTFFVWTGYISYPGPIKSSEDYQTITDEIKARSIMLVTPEFCEEGGHVNVQPDEYAPDKMVLENLSLIGKD